MYQSPQQGTIRQKLKYRYNWYKIKKEINVSSYSSIKNMKFLGTNLTKYIQDLYTEKCKTLPKDYEKAPK